MHRESLVTQVLENQKTFGLDHGVGHPGAFSLTYCSSRLTMGCRWYLDRCQDRGKHRPRLLLEKSLCCRGSIRTLEQKVVHRCEARTFPGVVESSQLVVSQREVPVAAFHIGTGTLEHFREGGRFLLQSVLLTLTQRTEGATGCKQWSPEVRSTLTKGSPLPDRLG